MVNVVKFRISGRWVSAMSSLQHMTWHSNEADFSLCRSWFTKVNMHFIDLHTVNFRRDALVKFHNVPVRDNANSELSDSNHILRLVSWVIRYDEAIDPIVIRQYMSQHMSILDQEMDHTNFPDAAWNTVQNVQLFEFHWRQVEPIYRVYSTCKFSENTSIINN